MQPQPDPAPAPARVIHHRASNGSRRAPITVRLAEPGHQLIDRRAAAECDGVRSEWVRRALRFAAQTMPPNWNG